MPTNILRRCIEDREVDFARVFMYDTGAVVISHKSTQRPLLRLTNASAIAKEGYLDKLLSCITDQETFSAQSRFTSGVSLELSPKMEAGFKFILDSNLQASAKFVYIVSYLHNTIALSQDSLERIIDIRPDPLYAIANIFPTIANVREDTLIRGSIFPDFDASQYAYSKSDEHYRAICQKKAFLSSPKAIRYGDFIKAHQEDFFIPSYPRMGVFAETVYSVVALERVEDLYPLEYQRFMRYFNHGIVKELRAWARFRFDSGVTTINELEDKGVLKAPTDRKSWKAPMDPWRGVIAYMTESEAEAFSSYIKKSSGLGKLYRGASEEVTSLLAYYWAEGGSEKLEELALHISRSQLGRSNLLSEPIARMNLSWKNPYALKDSNRPDLRPYVQALIEPELKGMPLEWALATG